MNEFELIFDENKKKWFIRFIDAEYFYNPYVSVSALINPNEEQEMFLKQLMYQKMLQWLKEEHKEFFI